MRVLLIYLHPLDNDMVGLMYIGTVLNQAGHEAKLIGLENKRGEGKIIDEITCFKPGAIGLSITTPVFHEAKSLVNKIKAGFPEIALIAGGAHTTIMPQNTLQDIGVDICVMGEGELTIIDLLNALRSKRPLEEVNGIAFLKNGQMVLTQPREFIEDLDSLPYIDRELLPKRVIYGRAGYPVGNPCMLISTVRGCPYQCTFCQPTITKIFGKKIRRRSAENSVGEIVSLKKKYGIRGLWINDDTFILDDEWIEKFCQLMIKEKVGILWYANGRINRVRKDILIKMRNAGCVGLVLTPESGSARIRNKILNKNLSQEEIIRAYDVCHEIGLSAQANIMLGSPTETLADLDASLDLIQKIQPHFMNFSYTTAWPCTYMHDEYISDIRTSSCYNDYRKYDVGVLKKIRVDIPDEKLINAWNFFLKYYHNYSFINRARHFFRYSYIRKILYKRWLTLIFNRPPNFKHLIYDVAAIILGYPGYFIKRKMYRRKV